MTRFVFSLVLLASISAGACGSKPDPVRFSSEWPAQSDDYDEVTERWTRRGVLRAPIASHGSQLLEVYATYLSGEWRAAYVERQSELQKLNEARKDALASEQRGQQEQFEQLQLLVTTYHNDHNDLHRENSMWHVVLLDESGAEVVATKVERDRRPRQVVATEFPKLGDFAEAYVATFPKSQTLLQGKSFTLRLSSNLGSVDLVWQSE